MGENVVVHDDDDRGFFPVFSLLVKKKFQSFHSPLYRGGQKDWQQIQGRIKTANLLVPSVLQLLGICK